jgi:hypothetical protein
MSIKSKKEAVCVCVCVCVRACVCVCGGGGGLNIDMVAGTILMTWEKWSMSVRHKCDFCMET